MFPFEDESDQEEWDEFGAALRPGEFASQQALLPGGLASIPSVSYVDFLPVWALRKHPAIAAALSSPWTVIHALRQ